MAHLPFAIGEFTIRQLNGLFSLNDLHRAAGGIAKDRPSNFLRRQETQALIFELKACSDLSMPSAVPQTPLKTVNDGESNGTYACRELVIAYAAWISAAFHLKVIRVFLAATAPQPAAPETDTMMIHVDAGMGLDVVITRHINIIHKLSYDYVSAMGGEASPAYLDNPKLIRRHERQLAELGVTRESIYSFFPGH